VNTRLLLVAPIVNAVGAVVATAVTVAGGSHAVLAEMVILTVVLARVAAPLGLRAFTVYVYGVALTRLAVLVLIVRVLVAAAAFTVTAVDNPVAVLVVAAV